MTDGDNIGLLGDTTALLARLVLCVRLAIAQPRSTECPAHRNKAAMQHIQFSVFFY